MAEIATINAKGIGICHHRDHSSPKEVEGIIITGSSDVIAGDLGLVTIGDIFLGECGHTSVMITGSETSFINNKQQCRIGDQFDGDITGVLTEAAIPNSYACANSLQPSPPSNPSTDDFSSVECILPKFEDDDPEIAPIIFQGGNQFQSSVSIRDSVVTINDDTPEEQDNMYIGYNYAIASINPNPTITSQPTEAEEVETEEPIVEVIPSDCEDISKLSSFNSNFTLSPNFRLGHVTTRCSVSNYSIKAQLNLSQQKLVCNLRKLCVNVLEPLTQQFGRPTVTSGFRHGSGSSWHFKGCAVDLQWPNLNDSEYYDLACYIKNNLIWCELILEYGGNRPWIHVAYNDESNNRNNFKTRTKVANTYVKGILKLRNRPYVGGV